jgi:hypothetical protein
MNEDRLEVSVFDFFRFKGKKDYNSDRNAIRKMNKKIEREDFHLVDLHVNCLIATQPYVDLAWIRKKTRYNPKHPQERPLIIKYKGGHYVADGHHRVCTEVLANCNAIKCRVIDLDGDMILDSPLLDFLEQNLFA